MVTGLLSDTKVRTAKSTEKEYLLADGSGLFVRVRPDGSKNWLFVFTLHGKQQKHGLKSYPARGLKEAREAAEECRQLVMKGVHPREAKAQAEAARVAEVEKAALQLTGRGLFEDWMAKELYQRKDQGRSVRAVLEKHALPYLGDVPAAQITRRLVMDVLDRAVAKNIPRQANILLQNLRQMFRFAVMREIMVADPSFGIKKKDVGGKEVERERVLSEAEIRQLYELVPAAGLTEGSQLAIWIVLSTICRIGELSLARWADVDLDARTWRIPAENAKNGKEHMVHLSEFARAQFIALKASQDPALPWLFPNRKRNGPRDTKGIQQEIYDRQLEVPLHTSPAFGASLRLPGGRWTSHDLRRSGATLMGELGVNDKVIDLCLNHVEPRKVSRTYQRAVKLSERKEAFRILGERLEMLSHEKVVGLLRRDAA